jgi:hypothetical protein
MQGEAGRASHKSIQTARVKSAISRELRSSNSQNVVSIWAGFEKPGTTTANGEVHFRKISKSEKELQANAQRSPSSRVLSSYPTPRTV